MAYFKTLTTTCARGGCSLPAKVEVFNRWNASCGKYCTVHGNQEVNKLKRLETEPKPHSKEQP